MDKGIDVQRFMERGEMQLDIYPRLLRNQTVEQHPPL
jgi:hypothetical protein